MVLQNINDKILSYHIYCSTTKNVVNPFCRRMLLQMLRHSECYYKIAVPRSSCGPTDVNMAKRCRSDWNTHFFPTFGHIIYSYTYKRHFWSHLSSRNASLCREIEVVSMPVVCSVVSHHLLYDWHVKSCSGCFKGLTSRPMNPYRLYVPVGIICWLK